MRFFPNPIKSSLRSLSLTRLPILPQSSPPSLDFLIRSFCSTDLHSSSSGSKPPIMTTAASLKSTIIGAGADVGISRTFWIKSRRQSILALYSPFVVCLAAGNVNIDAFRNYISQDVHFLRAFAQAYELAEDCADDDDAKVAISQLRGSVLEELKMHDSFVQEWGSDLVKDNSHNSAAAKYIDFLLATASGKIDGVKATAKLATPFEKTKIASYTLGAMTPCMRLYAFIGKELQALLNTGEEQNHPYQKWIDNYSSESFQVSARQTEDLLDKLSVSLTSEELQVIEKLYLQAMRLEIEFFNAQPLDQRTVLPLCRELKSAEWRLMLFSDFDLTCTVVDSSAVLAEIGILTAPKSDQNHPENQIVRMSSADLRNTWSLLSKQYTEEYEQCIASILSIEKAENFDYEGLCKALELLSDFEKKANDRVIESGVLKGVNIEDVKKAGGRLILQDGCSNFLQNVLQKEDLDVNLHVLSYCWCGDLIRSAFSSGGLHVANIHANEFTYDESISTGKIIKKVESPLDKVKAFSNILQSCDDDDEKKTLSVYIGDSVGDLLCLLKADIGIVLGSSSSLRKVGSHFGVSFVPLYEGLVRKQKEFVEGSPLNWKGLSGIVYVASSWAEIHALILGS
ncbi:hypothetical protein V2J09_007772 [Rumex salicifolius]